MEFHMYSFMCLSSLEISPDRAKTYFVHAENRYSIKWQYLKLTTIATFLDYGLRKEMESKTGISGLPLQWRHNGRNGVSNQQPYDCLLNHSFRCKLKKSKLRVTGLCAVNSPVTGQFPAEMASNTENVSLGWRNHASAELRRNINSPWLNYKHLSTAHLHLTATLVPSVTINNLSTVQGMAQLGHSISIRPGMNCLFWHSWYVIMTSILKYWFNIKRRK